MNGLPTVFVVDDDAAMREAFSSLLRANGLNVMLFSSAQEFLAAERVDAVSCLVLDLQLPGLSGLDLQHELRKLGEQIPVIFISGHGDIPTTVRAIKGGALEFLPKPLREQDLIQAISEALDQDRARRINLARLSSLRDRSKRLTAREREVKASATSRSQRNSALPK